MTWNGTFVGRLVCLAGFSLLPALAADAPQQTRSCWLRDLASPVPSNIYALCEQGSVWMSSDNGATWSVKETGAKGAVRAMSFLDAKHLPAPTRS